MKRILGIELGSTRIKSVITDENATVLAQGGYEWENTLVDGLWSYSMDEVEKGLQASYAELVKNYGQPITTVDAIGISAMMHGYIVFDKDNKQLVPNSHDGQEFDYILSGTMHIVIGKNDLTLNPGDSVYYDSRMPHAMEAAGDEPVQFLAIVIP